MKIKSVLLASSLLTLAACGPKPIQGRSDEYSPSQVNYVDQDLRDNTVIGQMKITFDESKLMHVDVPIRSESDVQLYADYRVTFIDANGIPLGPPTGWTAITLAPNVFQDIQVNSSSPRAADFRLDLRDAR